MPHLQPLISIIIPCYNSGQYLPDALESIKTYPDKNAYEVIIVDDGSTDQYTLNLLTKLQTEGYIIFKQENKGPAAARNTGVSNAKAEYLLFLDSDNKIRSSYIDQGIKILSTFQDVGVVYGNPAFFGSKTEERFVTRSFDMYSILINNYIDMCSVIRKKAWQEVGGFDEARILIGFEDWEFWIRVGAAEWKFYHVNETLFDYRVREDSVIKNALQPDKHRQMLNYVHTKHLTLFNKFYSELYEQSCYYSNDQKKPFRSFIKYFYNKYNRKS